MIPFLTEIVEFATAATLLAMAVPVLKKSCVTQYRTMQHNSEQKIDRRSN